MVFLYFKPGFFCRGISEFNTEIQLHSDLSRHQRCVSRLHSADQSGEHRHYDLRIRASLQQRHVALLGLARLRHRRLDLVKITIGR
jgi:hypothetical protein